MGSPIQEFQKDRVELLRFIEQNQGVFDQFFALSDRYNGSLTEAKQHVREQEPEGPLNLGPFKRNKAPVSTEYVPGKLPPSVLTMPGVVKQVDAKVVEALVVAGSISAAQVLDAKTTKTKTASVTGPKEIVVKL